MKISFDDKSYIECKRNNDQILLIISAKDPSNPLKKIINCVELDNDQFKKLISDIIKF